MGRIILKQNDRSLHAEKIADPASRTGNLQLLKKRSRQYMEVLGRLDAKTLAETKGMDELLKIIQEEFGVADISDLPRGIVAKCFLGHPHEVHTLDLSGQQIIRHFKIGEPLPLDFERARTLAKHNAYALVEVYRDKLILIREDGTAVKF